MTMCPGRLLRRRAGNDGGRGEVGWERPEEARGGPALLQAVLGSQPPGGAGARGRLLRPRVLLVVRGRVLPPPPPPHPHLRRRRGGLRGSRGEAAAAAGGGGQGEGREEAVRRLRPRRLPQAGPRSWITYLTFTWTLMMWTLMMWTRPSMGQWDLKIQGTMRTRPSMGQCGPES